LPGVFLVCFFFFRIEEFEIKAFTAETWDGFEHLAQKHNGVWGAAGVCISTPSLPTMNGAQRAIGGLKKNWCKKDALTLRWYF
jgi:hypothetical protein